MSILALSVCVFVFEKFEGIKEFLKMNLCLVYM